MGCLQGLLKDRVCPKGGSPLPALPANFDPATMSPWVLATIEGKILRTGNMSQPSNRNHAAIKSFSYGTSNGCQCKLEIVDEQGGAQPLFFKNLQKSLKLTEIKSLNIKFGWLGRSVDNEPLMYPEMNSIQFLKFNIMGMETKYENGIVKYIITGQDPLQAAFAGRHTKAYQGKLWEDCLKAFMEDSSEPPSIKVVREKIDSNEEWHFSENIENRNDFNATPNGMDKISYLTRTLRDFTTSEGNPIMLKYSPLDSLLHLKECKAEKCEPIKVDPCQDSIGTFLVNAGNCSNVIQFTPSINWIGPLSYEFGVGGGVGISDKLDTTVIDNKCNGVAVVAKNTGSGTSITKSELAQKAGLSDEDVKKNQELNNIANSVYSAAKPIEADLTIMGRPERNFMDMLTLWRMNCSVIVMNPMYIDNEDEEMVWLAKPPADTILTNRFWQIKGLHHEIREGQFHTTLRLYLIPGVDDTGISTESDEEGD